MNKPDFDEWLGFHFSRFTGCASWLQKFPSSPRFEGDPTQKSVVDGWREVLSRVELKHCKTATQLLAIGEEDFPERGFDCHARTVRAIAAKLGGDERSQQKPKWRLGPDGEELFDCGICRDTGFVILWHDAALRFFRKEFSEQPPEAWHDWKSDERWKGYRKRGRVYETCTAICTCQIGMQKRSSIQRYDDSRHVLFGDGDPRKAMDDFHETPAGGYGLDGEF